jgi:Fe-S oxidoreductase
MWMEETLGNKQINIERSEEAIATGAEQIAVACPFCKTMLADGVKEKGREDLVVMDVAELVADKLDKWVKTDNQV